MYDRGFVFTRIGKGIMHQTRSCRINLEKFSLTSENRRILKKGEKIKAVKLELPTSEYNWTIAKLAKDFYAAKFGDNVMSAQKIKEMLTNESKSNFNRLFKFIQVPNEVGFAICYKNKDILQLYMNLVSHPHNFSDLNYLPGPVGKTSSMDNNVYG